MKGIRKCFGKNSGRSAAVAGPSSWMKRGSNGKKPNYYLAKNSADEHAILLNISKILSRAAGQRASGPFFQNHSFRANRDLQEEGERYMPRLTKRQQKHNQERINRA